MTRWPAWGSWENRPVAWPPVQGATGGPMRVWRTSLCRTLLTSGSRPSPGLRDRTLSIVALVEVRPPTARAVCPPPRMIHALPAFRVPSDREPEPTRRFFNETSAGEASDQFHPFRFAYAAFAFKV